MTKFCPSCGEELIDDAKFCKSCGASLYDGANRAAMPERPLIEKEYKIEIIIGYVCAVFIPILGLIVSIYLMTRKDSSNAKKHGKYVLIVAVAVWILSFIMGMMAFY